MLREAKKMPQSDVVIVFPYKTDARVKFGDEEGMETRQLRVPNDEERHRMETWALKRTAAITALSDSGLVLMLFYSRDRDEIFVRVAADDLHLRRVAEMKRHKLELHSRYLSAFAEYKNNYPGRREVNFSDRRIVEHLFKAHVDKTDTENKYPEPGLIFRTPDRIALIDYIIRSSDHNCAGLDIGQLMHDRDLNHYFPLHENRKLKALDEDWFHAFAWGTHIDEVRDYFGERIALYFLFMSHLNKWLVLPAIGGVSLWIIDMFYGTPDNKTDIVICIGMGFWSMFFIHFWRRTANTKALKWGTLGMGSQLEPTRPEFIGVSEVNPVTGRVDRYYPWSQRIFKVIFSYGVLTVTLSLLTFVIMFLFLLRHVLHKHGGRITFQIINALIVEVLNVVFTWVAKKLTDQENHRAYSEYANHLLAKTVVFKFVNSYISLYYIAFFKAHSHLFGMPMECVHGDCLMDLGSQLAIFMVTRITLQNFIELGWPYIKMAYRTYTEQHTFSSWNPFQSSHTVMQDISSPEKQCKKESHDLYEDMDEILILYGYTTLFVVACPWVPLLALIGGFLECFLDQKKLVLIYRRPFPMQAANNEPWDTAFDVFGILAMMTNLAVVIFVTHTFDDWTHAHKIMLFLAAEHGIIIARILVGLAMPALPRDVRVLRMQQEVLLHRHFNLGGEEDDHETRAMAMPDWVAPVAPVFDVDEDEEEPGDVP